MNPHPPTPVISSSVAVAARTIGVTTWHLTQLLDAGLIESVWIGPRRLVLADSLERYVRSLPTERAS